MDQPFSKYCPVSNIAVPKLLYIIAPYFLQEYKQKQKISTPKTSEWKMIHGRRSAFYREKESSLQTKVGLLTVHEG